VVFSAGAPVCTVTWNTPLVLVTLKMALRFDSDGILNPVEFSSDIPLLRCGQVRPRSSLQSSASHSFLSQSLAVVLSENSFTTRVPKSPVALQSDSGKTLQVPTKALGYDFGIYMIAYRR